MIDYKTIIEELSNRSSQMNTVKIIDHTYKHLVTVKKFQDFCKGLATTETVTTLDFAESNLHFLESSDFKLLFESIAANPRITSLNLEGNCLFTLPAISPDNTKLLVNVLAKTSIQHLNLTYNSADKLDSKIFQLLLNAMSQNNKLLSIKWDGLHLHRFSAEHMKMFSDFLANHPSMEYLSLAQNFLYRLSDESFKLLMTGIAKSKKLEKFDFYNCHLGRLTNNNFIIFTETLCARPKISILNLRKNALNNDSKYIGHYAQRIEQLAKIFKKHTAIVELRLSDNPHISPWHFCDLLNALGGGGDSQLKQLEKLEIFECHNLKLQEFTSSKVPENDTFGTFCKIISKMKNLRACPIRYTDIARPHLDKAEYLMSILPNVENYSSFPVLMTTEDYSMLPAKYIGIACNLIKRMKKLKAFEFNGLLYDMSPEALSLLLDLISAKSANQSVTHLDLTMPELSEGNRKFEFNKWPSVILNAIENNTNLEQITLKGINVLRMDSSIFQALIKALSHTGKITQFSYEEERYVRQLVINSPTSTLDQETILKRRILNETIAINQHRQALAIHHTLKSFEQRKIGNQNFPQTISTKILGYIYTTYTQRHKKLWAQTTAELKKHQENKERQAENDIRVLDADIKALQDELQGLLSEKENGPNKP